MDDDDKPRRNLMVVSILFITYSLAGGSIDDHITYMKLSRPEAIEYIALAMFVYFYWAFWVTHRNKTNKFLPRITARMKSYHDQFMPLVETALKPSVPQENAKQLAFEKLIQTFRQQNNAPTPNRVTGKIFTWNVEYTGGVDLVMPTNTVVRVELDLAGTIPLGNLTLLWLKALFVESFTTTLFKDIVLPYMLALIAIIMTAIRTFIISMS